MKEPYFGLTGEEENPFFYLGEFNDISEAIEAADDVFSDEKQKMFFYITSESAWKKICKQFLD